MLMRLEVVDMVSLTTLEVSEYDGSATRAEDAEVPTTCENALLTDSVGCRPSASGPVIGAYIMSVPDTLFSAI